MKYCPNKFHSSEVICFLTLLKFVSQYHKIDHVFGNICSQIILLFLTICIYIWLGDINFL